MMANSRVLWKFYRQTCDIIISLASRSMISLCAVPIPWRVEAQGLDLHRGCYFFFSSVYDFEAGIIFTGVRIAAFCSFNVFMMCGGYFRDVINSSEREGFCDWMFRQVALFLQLVLVCQKMAHLIIFTDYITSKSTNISRTLKIKSKFLHINRKWQSNRQYTFH